MLEHLLQLDRLGDGDAVRVGAKNANLGTLHRMGLRTPRGYALPREAYASHLTSAGVRVPGLNGSGLDEVRRRILSTPLDPSLTRELTDVAGELGGCLAIRSSLYPYEDHPQHTCAGVFESLMNVPVEGVGPAIKACFASVFSQAAWAYFEQNQLDPDTAQMAVGVQETIDCSVHATVFSCDPVTRNADVMLIEAAFGFGEIANSGLIESDRFLVKKARGRRPYQVLARRKGTKAKRFALQLGGGLQLVPNTVIGLALSDAQLERIARDVAAIEQARGGPQDVELGITAAGDIIYLQARGQRIPKATSARISVSASSEPVACGDTVVFGAAVGTLAPHQHSSRHAESIVCKEEVLVTDIPKLYGAKGLIVRNLPVTSHPAIHLREVGVPTLAIGDGWDELAAHTGNVVTLDCTGERGLLYRESARLIRHESSQGENTKRDVELELKIALITSYPSPAWADYLRDGQVEGVHVRGESIIYDDVRVHPLALCDYDADRLDGPMRALVERKMAGYATGQAFYEAKFTERLGIMRCMLGDDQVITLRLTDLQTTDYHQLVGGELYEAAEKNPMLGLRGAARHLHPDYLPQLRMELAGLARATKNLGGRFQVLAPMVRSTQEVRALRDEMRAAGLDVPLGVMVETVAAVLLGRELARLADFFTIGPADLAQAVSSADRDHPQLGAYANPASEAAHAALELFFERIGGSGSRVYLPLAAYSWLLKRPELLTPHQLCVFTWPDRFLHAKAELSRAGAQSV